MAQIKIYQHEFKCPHCKTVLESGLGQINPMDFFPPSFNCRHCHNLIVVATEEAYHARKRFKELLKEKDDYWRQERKKGFFPTYLSTFLILLVVGYLGFSKLGSVRVNIVQWLVIMGVCLLLGYILAYVVSTRRAAFRLKPYLDEKEKELMKLNIKMNSKS